MASCLILAAACSDSDPDDSSASPADAENSTDNSAEANGDGAGASDNGGSGSGGSGGGGQNSLVIDGENVPIGNGLCHLEPQELLGGGDNGMILAAVMASGTNSAGDRVEFDFTRYDADTVFHGDDLNIEIGPLTDPIEYRIQLDEGTIPIVDGVLSAADLTLEASTLDDLGPANSIVASFEIHC